MMAKGMAMQRSSVVKWFGEQAFEAQGKILSELEVVFEKGKAGKIRALEDELARLRTGRGATARPAAAANKPVSPTKKAAAKANPLAGRKIAPKYRHPKDRTKTWAGRGVHPTWVSEYLKGGGKLESLLIKK